MTSPGLTVKVLDGEGGIVLCVAGTIDEHSEAGDIVPRTAPLMIFDLDGVERVTSYGVINWLSAMKALEGKQYAFARCRPSMVRQFNMITAFGRKGQLLSVYLPYFCSECSDEYELLMDLTEDFARVSTRKPPLCPCPQCGKLGEFDDAAETYFAFGAEYGAPQVSPALRKLMTALTPLPHEAGGSTGSVSARPRPSAPASAELAESTELKAFREGLKVSTDRLAKLRGGRDS